MTTQYWLVKSEPESYSWETFVKDGRTSWDGVRNFAARNHLRAMKVGDRVLFYASVTGKAVQGIAEVSKTAYADPTTEEGEGDWSSVELKAVKPLKNPVSLEQMKSEAALKGMVLFRQGRLSVSPVTKEEFTLITKLGG
jgi:predicted RNA-binding protein with PUA-like domain